MRVLKNIVSQLHVYVVWLILSVVLWGFVFNILTDAPAEKKLVLFAEVAGCRDRELSSALEKHRPEGIRFVQAHSFNYAMFDQSGLLNADLDTEKFSADALTLLELDGQPCGILVWDGEKGSAADYLDYGEGEYYLFLGANSLHAGEKDDAAYELLGEILQLP